MSTRYLIGSYRHLQAPYLYLPSLALRAGHCSVPGVHCSLHVVPAPACVSYFTFKYPCHFCSAPWTYLCYFTLAISLSYLDCVFFATSTITTLLFLPLLPHPCHFCSGPWALFVSQLRCIHHFIRFWTVYSRIPALISWTVLLLFIPASSLFYFLFCCIHLVH